MVFYSYGHLLVITGYFNGIILIIHSINVVLLVLITGITRAITVLCLDFAHRKTPSKIYQQNSVEHVELRAYEKVQHHQDGNRIAKVLKFKSHRGLGRVVQMPLLVERDVAMFFATNMEGTIDN